MKDITTLLQIDLQNLFYAAKNRDQRIDFEKIWSRFHERDAEFLTDAIIYMIRSTEFDSSKFEAKLKSIGYSLRIKNSAKSFKGTRPVYRQSNHDLNIAIECLDRIDTFSKWILMSGDGDFADLCAYLKDKKKQIEIWSFKEAYNSDLERYADRIHIIEDEFFFKKPSISVFGFNQEGPDAQ